MPTALATGVPTVDIFYEPFLGGGTFIRAFARATRWIGLCGGNAVEPNSITVNFKMNGVESPCFSDKCFKTHG